MEILLKTYLDHPMHEAFKHDVFHMLVAVILSQRATDAMTIPVAKNLFATAPTPRALAKLPLQKIEAIIKPIGFYHQKAAALKKLSAILVEQYHGKVPSKEEQLLALPQVGRKTANIILTMFFDTPQIAVDVHVHRIANRLGWIRTKTPEETECELTRIIPKEFHERANHVFVRHGQVTCRPLSPWCSRCPVRIYCKRVGVTTSR
jgi:endonuclease-3